MRTNPSLAGPVIFLLAIAGYAPTARAQDPDPWDGPDKVAHVGVSAVLSAGSYAASRTIFDASRGTALAIGTVLALGAGIAKETLDGAGFGDPSWRDLACDVAGTAGGLVIAWGVDTAVGAFAVESHAHPSAMGARFSGRW